MADEPIPTVRLPNPRFCSFCAKTQAEVAFLIAGPAVYICDECFDLCAEMIGEHLKVPGTHAVAALRADRLNRVGALLRAGSVPPAAGRADAGPVDGDPPRE